MVLRPPVQTRHADEQRQIAHVQEDLLRAFPHVPAPLVAEQVRRAVTDLQSAPVRAFIPVLVRRGATQRLRQLT